MNNSRMDKGMGDKRIAGVHGDRGRIMMPPTGPLAMST
jgi:hypothetical protein